MYMTEQRKKLFEFFKSHPDMTISARDLAAQLVAEEHAKISVSAVYRNLAMLEREGLILRSPGKNNRENVYRYVSKSSWAATPVFRAKWSATSSKARCSAAVRM